MSWGILEMFGSITTLVFAIPPALLGVELLSEGNLFLGGGLLGAGLAMVLFDQYVTTPGDLPGLIGSKIVDAILSPPEGE
jgi:hypothetical protein